jgi:CRISPR system Cascade subunit CasD
MSRFLILKLDGPMQAWGGHTYEDFRPSHLFPTRSGLLGLLGACLGIDRHDREGLQRLAESVEFTVRSDRKKKKRCLKLPDFHTVLEARKVDGSVNKNPVVSRREYLFDASFTVAVGEKQGAKIELDVIAESVRQPRYTPSLGRRSCPLARPLFDGWHEAETGIESLKKVLPVGGVIYGEGSAAANDRPMPIRDVPQHGPHRQFGTRWIYLHAEKGGE